MSALAPVLEGYFTQRLAQRRASGHTIASYRDAFTLLLRFAQQRLGKPPASLDLADLDAALIGAFLDDLEHTRGNGVATRNLRLTAVHSFFSYAALRCPEHAAVIQSWPSPPNDPTAQRSPSSPAPRPTRCSPAPTRPARWVDATTCCYSSPSRPACASPNSPPSPAATPPPGPPPSWPATAKAANSAPPR